MEFTRGFMVNGVFIGEGAEVKATTVQGVVVEGILESSAKKKMGIKLTGEIETRVFELDSIVSLVDVGGDECDEEDEDFE